VTVENIILPGRGSLQTCSNVSFIKAFALMVHGLNFAPRTLKPLIEEFNNHGVEVMLLSLAGHTEKVNDIGNMQKSINDEGFKQYDKWGKVTRNMWIDSFYKAHQIINTKAQEKNLPLVLVAASLGGLLGLDLIAKQSISFNKMILFAPAISLRTRIRIVRLLKYFPFLPIPSLTPSKYRSHCYTPISAYNALFDSKKSLDQELHSDQSSPNLSNSSSSSSSSNKLSLLNNLNIPTLVFVDPQDEFVSSTGIERFIQSNGLNNWKMEHVHVGASMLRNKYHHLITQKDSVGKSTWDMMTNNIKLFLQS